MIRIATVDDLHTLGDLALALYEASPAHKNVYSWGEAAAHAILIKFLISPDCVVFIDEYARGFFIGRLSRHWSGTFKVAQEVVTYVSPNSKNKHMLREMINKFEDWACGEGASYISIGVSSGAHNAERLIQTYEKMGYASHTVSVSKRIE